MTTEFVPVMTVGNLLAALDGIDPSVPIFGGTGGTLEVLLPSEGGPIYIQERAEFYADDDAPPPSDDESDGYP